MAPVVRPFPRSLLTLTAAGALLGAACGQLTAAGGDSIASGGGPRFGAWITNWDFARGVDRLHSAPLLFDDVFFFVAELGPDGRPTLARPDLPQAAALRDLRARGVRTWLTVVNDRRASTGRTVLKDAAFVHGMLTNAAERATHRRAIVELAALHGFSGVDIDYENLLPEDRDAFSAFVRELAADLTGRGLRLSVTVQPKHQESRSAGPGAADWAQLCLAAERVQVMLYNLHSARSNPGPLTAPDWIRQVLAYGRSQCDAARIVPVLKLAGIDWGPAGARDLQHSDIMALLATHQSPVQREADGGAPYFRYAAADGPHTVYFEDAESILKKVSVLEELGCAQVVLWSLGREDPQLLPRLVMRKSPPSSPSPGIALAAPHRMPLVPARRFEPAVLT